MQRLIIAFAAGASLVGCGLQVKNSKPAPNYTIENDQFVSDNKVIPVDCFTQLVAPLNKENATAAVFIESANLRGCSNANYSSSIRDELLGSYQIKKILPDHHYQLKVCKAHDKVNQPGICDQIVVQFTNLDYQLAGSTEQVLSMIKRGEW